MIALKRTVCRTLLVVMYEVGLIDAWRVPVDHDKAAAVRKHPAA